MTHLHDHIYVKCPYTRAKAFLREALDRLAENHEQKQITLKVPFAEGMAQGALRKDVLATYSQGIDPMHFDHPYRIHWKAEGGAFPVFDGELTVRADEDYTTSILGLTGDYEPPMGIAGAVFDAIAGSRIAKATAQELLKSIAMSMEQRHAVEEAAKLQR